MFVVFLMIFLFSFSSVKCDNTTMPTSIESMTEQMEKTEAKLDTQQFNQLGRQRQFMPMLRNMLNGIVFLARNILVTYNWYIPELKLGGCIVNYARTQYPELIQTTLTYDNIFRFVRSVFGMMYGYVKEFVAENRQGIAVERDRIGAKVAQLTEDDTNSFNYAPSSPQYNLEYSNYMPNLSSYQQNRRRGREEFEKTKSFDEFESRRRIDSFKFNDNNFLTNSINKKNMNFSNSNIRNLSEIILNTDANYIMPPPADTSAPVPSWLNNKSENKFSKIILKDNSNVVGKSNKREKPTFSIMYIGPRQFPATQDLPPTSSAALEPSDLNYKTDDEKGDSLFDFESVILETFGLNAKEVKSSSVVRCTQKYVIHVIWRMIEGFIRMV